MPVCCHAGGALPDLPRGKAGTPSCSLPPATRTPAGSPVAGRRTGAVRRPADTGAAHPAQYVAEPGPVPVEDRIRGAVLASDLRGLHPGIVPADHPDDLLFRKTAQYHGPSILLTDPTSSGRISGGRGQRPRCDFTPFSLSRRIDRLALVVLVSMGSSFAEGGGGGRTPLGRGEGAMIQAIFSRPIDDRGHCPLALRIRKKISTERARLPEAVRCFWDG